MKQATTFLVAILALALSPALCLDTSVRSHLRDLSTSKTTLSLINTDTDKDVTLVLTSRYLIDMGNLPRFTMRANPALSFATQSVKFMVDNKVVRVENSAPYALHGNSGSNFFPWTPTDEGMTTFKAIPYSGKNATGTAGPTGEVAVLVRFPYVEPPTRN